MDSLISLLVLGQALGAGIGTFAAFWGELSYIRALRDGKIDIAERHHLHALAHGLRFGMTVLLLASLGLVITMYNQHATVQPASTTEYWTLIALALLIIVTSWALSRRRISFALGSAMAFTGWWFLAHLTFGWLPPLTFGAAIGFFIVATALLYAVLTYLRHLSSHLARKS